MADARALTPALGDILPAGDPERPSVESLSVRFEGDVAILAAPPRVDARGRLVEFDFAGLPFEVRRVFVITDVPSGTARGGHRHRRGTQALFCASGRVEVELRRSGVRSVVRLTPDSGVLLIRAGVWARQHYVEEGTQLLVLASEPYDPASYDARP